MPDDNIKCSREHCYVPGRGETCNEGHLDVNACPHFRGSKAAKSANKHDRDATSGFHFPWSGNSLGLNDFSFISGRSHPHIIGIVGPHNAGKTTLLTVQYLLLSRGNISSEHKFAGSYTFGGWENLAHYMRWKGNIPPTFPPHTSSSDKRRPGLLHLSFRQTGGSLLDLALTDAPGEWFSRWALDKNDQEAGGARWTAYNSDAFILIVDCESLVGQQRGVARESIERIAERLNAELANRPVAVVWTKSDIAVKESVKNFLQDRFANLFPDHEEFHVSVKKEGVNNRITESAFKELWRWILTRKAPSVKEFLSTPPAGDDLFLIYRG